VDREDLVASFEIDGVEGPNFIEPHNVLEVPTHYDIGVAIVANAT
jgi:hypothetical protein